MRFRASRRSCSCEVCFSGGWRWHRDPFQRISVVFKGEALSIEFRDGGASVPVALTPGQVDWDEPGDRIHRAANVGRIPYEEVTIFFLAHPDDVPQPEVH